jgi:hypothetical protein
VAVIWLVVVAAPAVTVLLVVVAALVTQPLAAPSPLVVWTISGVAVPLGAALTQPQPAAGLMVVWVVLVAAVEQVGWPLVCCLVPCVCIRWSAVGMLCV